MVDPVFNQKLLSKPLIIKDNFYLSFSLTQGLQVNRDAAICPDPDGRANPDNALSMRGAR